MAASQELAEKVKDLIQVKDENPSEHLKIVGVLSKSASGSVYLAENQ